MTLAKKIRTDVSLGLVKPELVLPAGTLEKGKTAFLFGADACYGGLAKYSLRRAEVDTGVGDIKKLCRIAHAQGKKFYVTFNIFAHPRHFHTLENDLRKISEAEPDSYIVSDPGVLEVIRRTLPKAKIHLSTQANTLNAEAVRFWQGQGVDRIVLARELTLKEIGKVTAAAPSLEYEMFVQGAMCMAYSGRCVASSLLTGRSANLGDCTQTCRWEYRPRYAKAGASQVRTAGHIRVGLEEKKRPDWIFDIEEYEDHTAWLSSKDLCLIEHIGELAAAGVTAFKVEGRNKSAYYVAMCAKTYREGIDLITEHTSPPIANQPLNKKISKSQVKKKLAELRGRLHEIPHRAYSEGMLFGHNEKIDNGRRENCDYKYAGVVMSKRNKNGLTEIRVKERMSVGDEIELITPQNIFTHKILEAYDKDGKPTDRLTPGQADTRGFLALPLTLQIPVLSVIRIRAK